MELTQEDKNILIIGEFFKRLENEFKITGISLKSSKANKQEKYDPVFNIYPLIIRIMDWPLTHTFHWTGKEEDEIGFKQINEYITDKKGKKYSVEEMKLHIQKIFPEAFKRDFYQNKTNISMNQIDGSYDAVQSQINTIKLTQELDSSLIENLKNGNQASKKIKV